MTHELLTQNIPYDDFDDEDIAASKEKILNARIAIDPSIEGDTRNFIDELLQKDVKFRLGYENDAADVKKHPFFASIDWDLMAAKHYPAPVNNGFESKYDTDRFSPEFTSTQIKFTDNSTQKIIGKTFPGKYH